MGCGQPPPQAYLDSRANFKISAEAAQTIDVVYSKALGRNQSHPDVWVLPPTDTLAELDPYNFRLCVAAAFGQVGFGQNVPPSVAQQYKNAGQPVPRACPGNADTPKGRREAYRRLIAPYDSDPVAAGFIGTGAPQNGSSSCGIFIRGMWQLLGAGFMGPTQPSDLPKHEETQNGQKVWVPTPRASENLHFYSDYGSNQVMEDIGGLADTWGARRTGAKLVGGAPPFQMGDVIYISWSTPTNGHHIFTITSIGEKYLANPKDPNSAPRWDLYSTDGGVSMYAGDNDCMALGARVHTLIEGPNGLQVSQKTSSAGNSFVDVGWWVDLGKMQPSFNLPWMYPYTPKDIDY